MTEKADFAAFLVDTESRGSSRSCNKSIPDDRQTSFRRLQDGTRHCCDFEPTNNAQPVKSRRFAAERKIFLKGAGHHFDLALKRSISDACTPSNGSFRPKTAQRDEQGRGGRCITDAHLPYTKKINSIVQSISSLLAPNLKRLFALDLAHRRFPKKIRSPSPDGAEIKIRLV